METCFPTSTLKRLEEFCFMVLQVRELFVIAGKNILLPRRDWLLLCFDVIKIRWLGILRKTMSNHLIWAMKSLF